MIKKKIIYIGTRLVDIIEILPSFKRIVISPEIIPNNMEPINVEVFRESKKYSYLKFRKVKYIAPEFDNKLGLPYLFIQIKE